MADEEKKRDPIRAVFACPTVDEEVVRSQFGRLQREFGPMQVEITVDKPRA